MAAQVAICAAFDRPGPSLPVGGNESAASRRSRYHDFGVESAGVESRYAGLLDTVRRKRDYCALGHRHRPADDSRLLDSGARGGRSQRSAIFDERKVLEEAVGKVRRV